MIYLVIIAVAAAVAFWPAHLSKKGVSLASLAAPATAPQAEAKPVHTYMAAIDSLAYCRARLIGTDLLDDKAKAAIDVITLALVAGSDKT